VVTFSSPDEAGRALANGEAVLGCDGVELQQLMGVNDLAAPAAVISQVSFQLDFSCVYLSIQGMTK